MKLYSQNKNFMDKTDILHKFFNKSWAFYKSITYTRKLGIYKIYTKYINILAKAG